MVDASAVRAAIGRELQRPAVAPGTIEARSAQGHLTIALDADRHVVMIYRDASGREVLRATAVPGDPTAAIGMITLLAGNLARNEALDLAALFAPPAPPPPAAPSPPPAPAPPPLPAATPVLAPAVPVAPEATPVLAPAMPVRDRPARGADAYLERHGGHLGIHAAVGVAMTAGGDGPFAVYTGGVALRFRHFAIGLDGGYGGYPFSNYPYGATRNELVTGALMFTGYGAVGPLRLEAGGGVGYTYTSRHYAGSFITTFDTFGNPITEVYDQEIHSGNVMARVSLQASLPVARWLDVFARVDGSLAWEGRDSYLLASVGLQARVFQ